MPSLPRKHNASAQRKARNRSVEQRQAKRFYPTYHKVWRAHRQAKLNLNPLCEVCDENGIIKPATEVDHINGRSDRKSDYVMSNYQSLCKSCHSKKTWRQTRACV